MRKKEKFQREHEEVSVIHYSLCVDCVPYNSKFSFTFFTFGEYIKRKKTLFLRR